MHSKSKLETESIAALIERSKAGEVEALEALYSRFEPLILKIIRKMDGVYREDVKQELIEELFRAVLRFKVVNDYND